MSKEAKGEIELTNESKGNIVCRGVQIADSFISRLKGLMFSSLEGAPNALILDQGKEKKEGSSVHMFFMNFPLDLFWLNKKGMVVDIRKCVFPARFLNPCTWKIYVPKRKARYVVEIPLRKGISARSERKEERQESKFQIEIGDKLSWNQKGN